MTTINSIGFNNAAGDIGGAQIPAHAFNEWCKILGVDCTFSTSVKGECDWMFLSTPGPMVGKTEIPTVPFAMMIHAEFDYNLYESLHPLLDSPLCKLVVVIGLDYWKFPQKELYWHPCTLPRYLIKEDTEFSLEKRKGLIYAARVSSWKGINKLAALSNYKKFYDAVDRTIDIFGGQSSDFDIEPGRYNWSSSRYSIMNGDMDDIFPRYKYFWDVSGSPKYKIKIPRLNLAAVEAMSFGCTPVADPDTAYPFADWIIDLRKGFPKNYRIAQMEMKDKVLKSPCSYDAVQKQVTDIIDFMEKFA